ncbi:MAG: hypothetical protein IH602_14405 [Bryobacteraceae bacterium]|nr:hypothetical protein [Bryobacteraceae bacterium]
MSTQTTTVTGARAIAAVAIVSALAAGASIEYYGLFEKVAEQSGDAQQIGSLVERFAGIPRLTGNAPRIGYFNDRTPGSVAQQAALASAQFALAPQILVLDENRNDLEYWVGDFNAPRDFAGIGKVQGLELVADLGRGVVLYRRGAGK